MPIYNRLKTVFTLHFKPPMEPPKALESSVDWKCPVMCSSNPIMLGSIAWPVPISASLLVHPVQFAGSAFRFKSSLPPHLSPTPSISTRYPIAHPLPCQISPFLRRRRGSVKVIVSQSFECVNGIGICRAVPLTSVVETTTTTGRFSCATGKLKPVQDTKKTTI